MNIFVLFLPTHRWVFPSFSHTYICFPSLSHSLIKYFVSLFPILMILFTSRRKLWLRWFWHLVCYNRSSIVVAACAWKVPISIVAVTPIDKNSFTLNQSRDQPCDLSPAVSTYRDNNTRPIETNKVTKSPLLNCSSPGCFFFRIWVTILKV